MMQAAAARHETLWPRVAAAVFVDGQTREVQHGPRRVRWERYVRGWGQVAAPGRRAKASSD